MATPEASIIIPTYNRGDVISRAIDSVLNQTVKDLELIIIDDGSTDDTHEVVNQYTDPRVRMISHEENQGGSAARNTGISNAEGEYIAFLDSDDEWHPSKLEYQIDELESRSEEWIAIYCDIIPKESNSSIVKTISTKILKHIYLVISKESDQQNEGGTELIDRILMREFSTGGASTLLLTQNAIKKVGRFDPSFQRHQDFEFLIRLLRQGKLAYIDKQLVTKYNMSTPPASAVKTSKRNYLLKYSDDVVRLELDGHNVIGRHNFELSKFYFLEGNSGKAIRLLLNSEPSDMREFYGLLNNMIVGLLGQIHPSD